MATVGKVKDGAKDRSAPEVDFDTAPTVEEVSEVSRVRLGSALRRGR